MDVPLESISNCSRRHDRNGFMKIKGQRVITIPYAYLKNYPDSVISFHDNGIYISKNSTNLMEYCNKYFPPMCYKN
jgi:hypothetical protein